MTGENSPTNSTSPVAAPVQAAPSAAPAAPAVSEAAPAAASTTAQAPSTPAQPAQAAAEVPKEAPKSVLGAEPAPDAKVEAKTETKTDPTPEAKQEPAKEPVKADAEPKKEEGNQSDKTAQLPSYETFTLPEGVKLDDAKLGEFMKDLGQFEMDSKADHAFVQKFGQKLMDRYVAEIKQATEQYRDALVDNWNKQKNTWAESFEKDPEIGMNHRETTVKNAAMARELGLSYDIRETDAAKRKEAIDARRSEFNKVIDDSGVGNHPIILRTLHNLYSIIEGYQQKYESEKPGAYPTGSKPTVPQSKVNKRYGGTNK